MRPQTETRTGWMRSLLGSCLLVACLGGGTLAVAAEGTEKPRPNIVLFVADDLGKELGCYGNGVIKTPHVDALAKEGRRFDLAFATTASCSASRSVILTGLHNHANGQYGHEHAYHHFAAFERVRSLPVLLTAAGYRTLRAGKFHVGPEERFQFEVVLKQDSRNPVKMADDCREPLSAGDARPFFLYFCTSDPHRSGEIAEDVPGKPNRFGNRPGGIPGEDNVTYRPEDVIVPPFLPDTPVCRAELAQYYESVSRVDRGFGRLVRHLKELGKYDNTVILFTSDHGMAFPGAKTTVYEPGLQVPLIVRRPGETHPGTASPAMVSHVDLTPTILDLAGALDPQTNTPRVLPPPDKGATQPKKKAPPYVFQGRSWKEALDVLDAAGRDRVEASHTFHEVTMYYPMRVLRTRKYKLIWNLAHGLPFPFASDLWEAPTWQDRLAAGKTAYYGKRTVAAYLQRPPFELYDLETDPHEAVNLADREELLPVLKRMQGELRAFQQRTDDPWVLKWEHE